MEMVPSRSHWLSLADAGRGEILYYNGDLDHQRQ